jgi:hypothetical protein
MIEAMQLPLGHCAWDVPCANDDVTSGEHGNVVTSGAAKERREIY